MREFAERKNMLTSKVDIPSRPMKGVECLL